MRCAARVGAGIFLAFAACTSARFYEGEAKSRDQVAVIRTGTSMSRGRLLIEEVDGRKEQVHEAEVLPGYHSVRVSAMRKGYMYMPGGFAAQAYDREQFSVSVRAEAGHTYRIDWSDSDPPYPVVNDVTD